MMCAKYEKNTITNLCLYYTNNSDSYSRKQLTEFVEIVDLPKFFLPVPPVCKSMATILPGPKRPFDLNISLARQGLMWTDPGLKK